MPYSFDQMRRIKKENYQRIRILHFCYFGKQWSWFSKKDLELYALGLAFDFNFYELKKNKISNFKYASFRNLIEFYNINHSSASMTSFKWKILPQNLYIYHCSYHNFINILKNDFGSNMCSMCPFQEINALYCTLCEFLLTLHKCIMALIK